MMFQGTKKGRGNVYKFECMQELGSARCDALTKHMEINQAEKAALVDRCEELAAEVTALRADLDTAERRCEAAEASADAVAQVDSPSLILMAALLRWHVAQVGCMSCEAAVSRSHAHLPLTTAVGRRPVKRRVRR